MCSFNIIPKSNNKSRLDTVFMFIERFVTRGSLREQNELTQSLANEEENEVAIIVSILSDKWLCIS